MDPEKYPTCPRCGSRMTILLKGSDGQIHFGCPHCPENGKFNIAAAESKGGSASTSEEPRQRFRRLLQSAHESRNLELPQSLIDDLPEEARHLLQRDQDKPRPSIGPRLSDDLAQALRDQGYVIDEDSRGLRISGSLASRGSDPGKMSPYDVLRMAADLEGGLQKPGERLRCPNCEAVLPKGHTTCDWCGTSVE